MTSFACRRLRLGTSAPLVLIAAAALSLAACSGDAARFADFPGMSTSSLPQDEAAAPAPDDSAVVKAALPADRPAWQNAPATSGAHSGTVVVRPGQTLYSIARANGMTAAQLAEANSIAPPYGIRVGQRLRIPGHANPVSPEPTFGPQSVQAANAPATNADAPAPATAQPQMPPAAPQRMAAVDPAEESPPAPASPVIEAEPAEVPPAEQPAAEQPNPQAFDAGFRWPVKGRVVSTFGQKPNGTRNEGINIAVPEGTSVRAAEAGVVAYAGNELKGYGNLVLIRHDNGWVTAYAHNKELFVKRGDAVKRGDIIAKAGQTGSVTSPQVHFEIRKGATAVDPLKHLGSQQAMN
jgi:murein DD-endopeptidase MepM/ murein hydrolase activator NlpD